MIYSPRQMLQRSATDCSGAAALEFALIGALLVALLLVAFDIGIAVLQYTELNTAVRAGGLYAVTFPTDINGIKDAVKNSLPSAMQPSVTTTVGCECSDSGGSTDICESSGACGACGSSTAQRFVHVATTVQSSAVTWFTTLLAITPLSAPSACYVARVK